MFHGVAGKYSGKYDRPEKSMREWHRLFFINRRRLRNFIAAGALDDGSPAARLVGMPKVDCLVDGTLRRSEVLVSRGIDPEARTVLYAPTWTPYSSLNAHGEALITALGTRRVHGAREAARELPRHGRYEKSGGIDWVGRLRPLLARLGGRLVDESDVSPWMVAADVLISDHSSVGFEYLLLDRPLVRIEMPELLARTSIPPDYVALMVEASTSTRAADDTVAAVDAGFADPRRGSASRRAVVEELFHRPGTATTRALSELYDVLELAAPATAPVLATHPALTTLLRPRGSGRRDERAPRRRHRHAQSRDAARRSDRKRLCRRTGGRVHHLGDRRREPVHRSHGRRPRQRTDAPSRPLASDTGGRRRDDRQRSMRALP